MRDARGTFLRRADAGLWDLAAESGSTPAREALVREVTICSFCVAHELFIVQSKRTQVHNAVLDPTVAPKPGWLAGASLMASDAPYPGCSGWHHIHSMLSGWWQRCTAHDFAFFLCFSSFLPTALRSSTLFVCESE